jgi:hypothetical protein
LESEIRNPKSAMSTAASAFDPYYEWLGIEPREQPADFYRLLGIARFETDLARIAAAADQRMALVRSFQTGPRGVYTQRLLNELSAARLALLSPENKAAYDAALSRHLAARVVPTPMPMHPAYGGGAMTPAVLTFGLGQTAIPPAPPILPPPAPAQPVALNLDVPADEAPPEPATPVAWWRPLAMMIGVTLLVLAAVIGFGLGKPYLDRAFAAADSGTTTAGDDNASPQPPPAPPPPETIVLLQEGSGEVVFSPATAKLRGAVELQVDGTDEVLANWTTPEDAAEWHFKLVKPGFFEAEVEYATAAEPAGAQLELAIGERSAIVALRSSGGADQLISDRDTVFVSSTAEQTLVVRPLRQPEGDWLVLRRVRLIPAK